MLNSIRIRRYLGRFDVPWWDPNPSPLSDPLDLYLNNSTKSYEIIEIDGLGPVKSDMAMYSSQSNPGGYIYSDHTGMRNVVMSIELRGSEVAGKDITSLRTTLYRYFAPGAHLNLEFNDSVLGRVGIIGRVEDAEPEVFTTNPTIKVSILCEDPYFFAMTNTHVNPVNANADGRFKVSYPGTAPAGFKLRHRVRKALSEYQTITHDSAPFLTEFTYYYNSSYPIASGNRILTNTIKGQREMSIFEANNNPKFYNALFLFAGSLTRGMLYPGDNWFSLTVNPNDPSFDSFEFDFVPRYLGL